MALGSYFEKSLPIVDKDRWFSTGLHSIDILSGRGLMRGSVVQLYGKSQSRKSTAALTLVKAAQDAGFVIIYYDVEDSFLDHVALILGVNLEAPGFANPGGANGLFGGSNANSQVITSPGFLMAKGYEVNTIEDLFTEAERVCEACGRGGLSPFFVIDSMSRMSTKFEEKQGYSNSAPMTQALQLRKSYRLFLQHLNAVGGIFAVIDHQKETGNAGAGTSTGFFATTQLRFFLVEEYKSKDRYETPIGFHAEVSADKSRYAPRVTAPFVFSYETGTDYAADLFWAGQHMEFIQQAGAWYRLPEHFPGKTKTFQGKEGWKDFYYSEVAEQKDWISRQVDAYYFRRWYAWCAVGRIDPITHLKMFGNDTYERVIARQNDIFTKQEVVDMNEKAKASLSDTVRQVYARAAAEEAARADGNEDEPEETKKGKRTKRKMK